MIVCPEFLFKIFVRVTLSLRLETVNTNSINWNTTAFPDPLNFDINSKRFLLNEICGLILLVNHPSIILAIPASSRYLLLKVLPISVVRLDVLRLIVASALHFQDELRYILV